MNWKQFIMITGSIVAIAGCIKLAIACADGPSPYDNYVSFFQSNTAGKPQYFPFYYTDELTYYDEGYYGDIPKDDTMPDANIEAWHTYTGESVKEADIDSFMAKFTYDDVKGLPDAAPEIVKENTFCKWLTNSKNSEALHYLIYAKKCEPLVIGADQYWDDAMNTWKTPVRDTTALQNIIEEGESMYGKSKDEMIKWRYAYQVIRLAFYNNKYQQASDLYQRFAEGKTPDNLMAPRCLGLKAGILFRTGKKQEAAYLYTRVFDMSDDMKRKAYISFNWAIDTLPAETILPLCKTDHEKAVLYVMDGLYERNGEEFEGAGLLEKAYALDPAVKGLDIVMTREINKAEQRYYEKLLLMNDNINATLSYEAFNNYYSDDDKKEWAATKVKYLAYIDKLNSFSKKAATEGKAGDKAFWYLSAAYTYYLEQKIADSKKYMALAENEHMSPREKDVYDMMQMLCIVGYNSKIDPQTEGAILPSLQWIERHCESNARFQKMYRDVMTGVLANRYLENKDTVKAVYCLARTYNDNDNSVTIATDFTDLPGSLLESMSIDKLHELQRFVNKQDKTAYEKWLTERTPYSDDVLKELEGTKYIRELRFDKAVAVLVGVSAPTLAQTALPDFLISHLQDSQDWNRSDSANMYNKLQFAQKMLGLQQQLTTNPKDSRAAYQYANGLYSMSYYGKAHHAYDYYRTSSDDNAYYGMMSRGKLPDYENEYYNVAIARKYYLQAYQNTTDPELKARYLFMAAKCWQKSCPPTKGATNFYEMDENDYYINSLKNPDIKLLTEQYRKTKFFSMAYGTCSYLKDYVSKH